MKNRKEKSFTMIEIIFYIAMLSFFSFAIFSVLNIVNQERINSIAFSEVNYQGFLISEFISREIKTAKRAFVEGDNIIISKDDDLGLTKILFSKTGVDVIDEGGVYRLNNDNILISDFLIADNSSGSISFSIVVSFNKELKNSKYNYSKKFYGSATVRQ
ncbi:hypothetical protein M0R01_01380 [bacterium]|nr:hypothetical protein [bacterium]